MLSLLTISPDLFLIQSSPSFGTVKAVLVALESLLNAVCNLFVPASASLKDLLTCEPHSAKLLLLKPSL